MPRLDHAQCMPRFDAPVIGTVHFSVNLPVPDQDRPEAENIQRAFFQQLLRRIFRAFAYLQPSVRILDHHIQIRQVAGSLFAGPVADDLPLPDDDPDGFLLGHPFRVKVI